MPVELIVLGSGTVAPTAHRTAPAHWVHAGSVHLLMDCGAGVTHRAASFGLPWPRITHLAITHFHIDHWGELPHYLFALRWGAEPARETPLPIVAPSGFTRRLEHLATAYGDWVLEPGYPLEIREIGAGESVELADDVTLDAFHTPHTEESLAYAVREGDTRLVYTGDTGPSADVGAWARGCDLLLCECSLPEDRAIDIHLTPRQAGELARDAEAGHLVLTHFYPPVEAVDPAAIAATVYAGRVDMARDGDRFTIGA